jgi:hypothetical protein
VRGSQRHSKENWKTTLGSQGTLSENCHSDRLKKVHGNLSQGKKKKGERDEIADGEDDDDVVRTSLSQDRVTAALCTEELFLSTQYTVYSSPLFIKTIKIIYKDNKNIEQYIALPAYQMVSHVGGGGFGWST